MDTTSLMNVCDFTVQQTHEGTMTEIAFGDFKLEFPEKNCLDRRNFSTDLQVNKSIALRRVRLSGFLHSSKSGGTITMDVRIGAFQQNKTWVVTKQKAPWKVDRKVEPSVVFKNGKSISINVDIWMRDRKTSEKLYFCVDDLTLLH